MRDPSEKQNTIQQQQTIDAPPGDILVSAAAGSGKTSVMTERIVTRIAKGQLDIRNVLVMTFTEAAAKNMREKIEKQLRTALTLAATDRPLSQTQDHFSQTQDFLKKQLACLEQSSISTIHAFCLDVVRNFYYEAVDPSGKLLLEPGFRIEEQGEAKIILERALDDLFEKYYARCDAEPGLPATRDFLFLVDAFGSSKDDSPVRAILLPFYHFLRSMPDYEGWIAGQKELLDRTILDFDRSPCCKALHKGLLLRAERAAEGMEELEGFLSAQPFLFKNDKKNEAKNREMLAVLMEFGRFIREAVDLARNPDAAWDDLYSFFQSHPEIPNLKHHPAETEEKSEWIDLFSRRFAEFLYYTTGEFGTPRYASQFVFEKCFLFTRSKDETVRELAAMRPAMDCFFNILLDLDKEYTKAKREANMIDFDDFEHLALKILKVSTVKQYYKDKFQEIYIDEYHDTSSIQEAILQEISTGNCFMVGDVKQSIYKFRHARPGIFMAKYKSFGYSDGIFTSEPEGNRGDDSICKNVRTGTVFELNKNFRSAAGILQAVNDVFCQIMSKDAGEIDYDEAQSLVPGREEEMRSVEACSEEDKKVCAPVEILLVDLSRDNIKNAGEPDDAPDEESSDEEAENGRDGEENSASQEPALSSEETTKYQKEAFAVAVRIKELLEEKREALSGGKDPGTQKPGGIAVLARTKSICAVFADTLRAFGLPVEQEQTETFLDRYELKMIEALLIILDNPMQDIPLVSVMRAPLFENGFSEEELLRIRIEEKDREYFYECCKAYAAGGQDIKLKNKLQSFYKWLDRLRNRLAYQSVSELIETIYAETEFLAVAAKMPDGLDRVRSLQEFQDWAGEYDRSRQSGLYSFVRYMEAVHEKSPDQSPFGVEQSQTDSVKVMTMHKSKGLEYEVVFLVGNNRKMASMDIRDPILVSEEFGTGFYYVNVEEQFRYPTPLVLAMRESMRNADLAEEMRLLYVGMTRAKNRLFITGTFNSEENIKGRGLAASIEKAREYPSGTPLPPHVILSAKNTLEWIMMSIARDPFLDFTPLSVPSYKEKPGMNAAGEAMKTIFHDKSWSLNVTAYQDVQSKVQKIQDRQTALADRKIQKEEPYENDKEKPDENDKEEMHENDSEDLTGLPEEKAEERYRTRFLQEYPYKSAAQSPLKISVSEIKRREQGRIIEESPVSFPLPATPFPASLSPFRSVNTTMKALSGTTAKTTLGRSDIGIAVHSFLRYMDLGLLMANPTREAILEHMNQMFAYGMLKKMEYDCLTSYAGAFESYLRSDLANRIFLAYGRTPPAFFREIPFTVKLECKTFFKEQEFGSGDYTFVQGMIDCWFVENGEAVLIDYKTDRIEGSEERIRRVLEERYHTQLSIYAMAIEKTTGLRVKESILWLVDNEKEFIIESNK